MVSKLKFNKKRLEKLIQKSFPNAKIKNYKQFFTGLISPTFNVEIEHPKKRIVIKLAKLKNKEKIHQNNKILNYLYENNIPAPKVFFEEIFDKKYITIMDYIKGDVASKIYEGANLKLRKKILINTGKNLRKIHNLKIPSFWIHQHHEVKNPKEWKDWTKLRIDKYLNFFKKKLKGDYKFLNNELNEFWMVLKNSKIEFVPLHWDYHLSNLNVDYKGGVTGVFDFDNSMKGHNLADIGQTAYWIRFKINDYENFGSFLKGYKKQFNKDELKLIKGYFLLHLLAVSRTIWFRKKRLGWIIKEHKKILDEFRKGKF